MKFRLILIALKFNVGRFECLKSYTKTLKVTKPKISFPIQIESNVRIFKRIDVNQIDG